MQKIIFYGDAISEVVLVALEVAPSLKMFFIDLVEKQNLEYLPSLKQMQWKKNRRDYRVVKIARSPQLSVYVIEDIFLSNATYNK